MWAELGLQTMQEALEALIAHSPDCIKIIDHDGYLVKMSPKGQVAMEVNHLGAIIGAKWHELWPMSTRPLVLKALDEARLGRHGAFRGFCPTAAGNPRWWQVDVSPLGVVEGRASHFLAVSRDISHLYVDGSQVETLRAMVADLSAERERLLEAKADEEHSERLRLLGRFVGSIIHDLNNVLAAMQSASSLLRRRIDDGVSADILDHVDQAVTYGSQLTRQLLDLSRRDEGSVESLDLADVLERDADLLRHLVGRAITIDFCRGEEVPPVLASSSRIRSVIFNLIANSRDAIGGEGAIRIELNRRTVADPSERLQPGEYVELSFVDNGCGMPPEVVARLGEPFFTTKGRGKGTGLGLASAFELAELCDGTVEIESQLGVGTTIRLILAASAAYTQYALSDNRLSSIQGGDATILLVEDSDMLRQHIGEKLKSGGYTVLEAISAKSAIALAVGAASIDLLISDLQLDQGSGAEVARELRNRYPLLPMIFVSGSVGEALPEGEIFLPKPVDTNLLNLTVAEQLGRLPGKRLTSAQRARSDRVERRIKAKDLILCFGEWRSLCNDLGRLPSQGEFTSLKPYIERSGYVVEVGGTTAVPVFKFSAASEAVETKLGRPLLGTYITARDEESLGSVTDALQRCLKGIAYHDYLALNARGVSTTFERIMFPLSDDGWFVTHIVGVTKFSEGKG
ncbi:hybrid sensor histidine kinase/response regulator [Novosphingobium olei]|uniref:histidine kinase n=1 Tax=Novosphingobium olei TaxID=2728851 RepID=A0A7Y0BP42_9SPHN|nr:ATP-binding protein [Novosphingobium olei]NML93990.1 response regulator [Novosphingobium olei]